MEFINSRSDNSMIYNLETSFHQDHNVQSRQNQPNTLVQGPLKYWEVTAHCENLLFPQPRPEILFDNPAANYHYQRESASDIPDQQVARLVTQAHMRVLSRLNRSELQVRNFILPVQLMKMKYMDPYSRKRIIEDLCEYFSFQTGLRSVVLEQAEVKFVDLCRLLVAIAFNTKIKNLFLWHVLDRCDKPFEGPLQSDTVLDDLPRIPYTSNPGGRKYLRDLKKEKYLQLLQCSPESCNESRSSGRIKKMPKEIFSTISQLSLLSHRAIDQESQTITDNNKDLISQIGYVENIIKQCFSNSEFPSNLDVSKDLYKELKKKIIDPVMEKHEYVFSQADVGIQCIISQEFEEVIHVPRDQVHIHRSDTFDSHKSQTEIALMSSRLWCCKNYLKYYENNKINIKVLRDIYVIALNSLINLTQLAVNYCLLADGTGNALLSLGCVANGKLKHLKLLCEPEDVPSHTHELYDKKALQAIPDLIWHTVKKECPDLKVHIVCVSMSSYEVTKRFVTKSMPLSSFHMENGFCPTMVTPELTIFCTLKCLWVNHTETLEHVHLTLWISTGRIDGSLEKLIQCTCLRSFCYNGPVQYKATVNKLCDAALRSPYMEKFKLMVQGDPCHSHVAKELTSDLYDQYRSKFQEKSIHFTLGTFNS